MADFKCSQGKVLSQDEVAEMLTYDEVEVPRPDGYDDVVFDATGIGGAVYRCKTNAEKEADNAAAKATNEASAAYQERLAKAEKYKADRAAKIHGGDIATAPVNTGVRAVEGNTSVGDTGGDDGPNTGSRAGGVTTRRT